MSSPNNSRGFTLIEVMIASAVLAFGLVMIVESLGRTQQALRISQNLVTASQIGVSQISKLELKQKESTDLEESSDSGEEKYPGRVFRWASHATAYRGEVLLDETKLNQADVVVSWNEGPARKNAAHFATILMKRDKDEF